MKLSEHSKNLLLESFTKWRVDRDFADPMYNYLVYGYQPGSCFKAVLANDFARAMTSSHPGNTIEAFKALAGWILNTMPPQCFGSYDAVKTWCEMDEAKRRVVLEQYRLIYPSEKETWLVLNDTPTQTPAFY